MKLFPRSRIALVAIILALLLLLGYGALLWSLSSGILYPSYQCNEDHFVYCGTPSELGMDYEDVRFNSGDGVPLQAWYIPGDSSGRAIVFVHGHGADRHEGMRWFRAVRGAGYAILAIDLRNSGSSGGSYTSMGYYEHGDVLAAVDFLQSEKQASAIGVFGASMGVATSVMAMHKDSAIQAGVFEAGWANFEDLFSELLEQHTVLPRFPTLPLFFALLEWRADIDIEQLNPEEYFKALDSRPVFIMHCRKDALIPFEHGQRNFRAANNAEFWESPCEVHARAWQGDPEYIEKRVVDFFNRHLSDPQTRSSRDTSN